MLGFYGRMRISKQTYDVVFLSLKELSETEASSAVAHFSGMCKTKTTVQL